MKVTLSCKANARVKLANTGRRPHFSKLVVICVVLLLFVFYVLLVCKCVLYCCHRLSTQLHLTSVSYHIKRLILRFMRLYEIVQLSTFVTSELCLSSQNSISTFLALLVGFRISVRCGQAHCRPQQLIWTPNLE